MYSKELLEKLKARAGQKWRPSNGTEGMIFEDSYCGRCANDNCAAKLCNVCFEKAGCPFCDSNRIIRN